MFADDLKSHKPLKVIASDTCTFDLCGELMRNMAVYISYAYIHRLFEIYTINFNNDWFRIIRIVTLLSTKRTTVCFKLIFLVK